ncbi:MAG: CpaF family protein [Firmicutes bacterium]|nr:CpaF family protein [Bacillota bacterium]
MDKEEIKEKVIRNVRSELLSMEDLDKDRVEAMIIADIFRSPGSQAMDESEIEQMVRGIYYKVRGTYGILDPLIEDRDVNEIMVNGPENIFYEKDHKVRRYDMEFDSYEDLEEVIRKIAGQVHREINELNPIVDARLPDGSRVNGVYRNVAINGPILTIRKFSSDYITMEDLIGNGTLDREEADFLKALVACGYNIFISGGTSSGKTTLLNALSDAIPKEERVIVIEDSMELKLDHIENIVHMECRNANSQGKGLVTMADLIKTSLRMRPDRIIVGEVRSGEVVEMLQAMNTGHPGSMSTGHGNSVMGMLKRLESMYLMAVSLNVDAIRSQIAEGIDIMIHVERDRNGRRHLSEIYELMGYDEGKFIMKDLLSSGQGLDDLKRARLKGGRYAEILSRGISGRNDNWQDIL